TPYVSLLSQSNGSTYGEQDFRIDLIHNTVVYRAHGSSGWGYHIVVPLQISRHDWHHVAATNDLDKMRLFIGGALVHEEASVQGWYQSNTAAYICGIKNAGFSNEMDTVYLSNLRVTLAARYTTSFSPPTAPFPTA